MTQSILMILAMTSGLIGCFYLGRASVYPQQRMKKLKRMKG